MKEQVDSLFSIREGRTTDEAFIYSTWLKGLWVNNEPWCLIDSEVYFPNYSEVIKRLLARSRTFVACLKEDEDVILGYAVFENLRLHYAHSKGDWRNCGIQSALFRDQDIQEFSHLTPMGKTIWQSKLKNLKFNPFL